MTSQWLTTVTRALKMPSAASVSPNFRKRTARLSKPPRKPKRKGRQRRRDRQRKPKPQELLNTTSKSARRTKSI